VAAHSFGIEGMAKGENTKGPTRGYERTNSVGGAWYNLFPPKGRRKRRKGAKRDKGAKGDGKGGIREGRVKCRYRGVKGGSAKKVVCSIFPKG